MTRAYRAELVKLLRRRVLLWTAFVVLLFGAGATAVVLAAAGPAAEAPPGGRAPPVESLSAAGGGTEAFRLAIAFAGTFVFVLFVGMVAAEFSRGTFRTMLLREPRRLRLLGGKLLALLTYAAGALAATEAVAWTTARLRAPSAGVDTTAWTSLDALGAAAADYGAVLLWVTGYAVFGTTLAVLLRSVPVALGVGIAWAGPVEHITMDAWEPAGRVFPGLLLEAFAAGGTPAVSAGRALATVAAYAVVAAAVAGTVFARRDVTS